ncbi:MAG: cupin domain-containing protein [Lentisphaeria bacterium]|nr:cupin domain-containing protein [Candidatus Neomarinimicrobiota bacterium]MCF7842270.1 cupin domain-containing protein [Lentisphaeria bacterium]
MSDKNNNSNLAPATAYSLAKLVEYAPGSVVSRTIHKSKAGTITLFAFAAGQELSEHSAPYDAWLQVLDGAVKVIIGGEPVQAKDGEIVLLPANVPHAVVAETDFKMALTMIRG